MTRYVCAFELMWYSSFSYHMRPNCPEPTFHFLSLKSSTNGPDGVTLAFALGMFALTFAVILALRLVSRKA